MYYSPPLSRHECSLCKSIRIKWDRVLQHINFDVGYDKSDLVLVWPLVWRSFFHLLDAHIPSREGGDQVRLRLKRNGQFSVCSFYFVLKASNTILFSWKGIWGLRLHRGSPFLFGWKHGGRFLLVRTLSNGVIRLWVGIVCSDVVGRRWIIYWYTALLLGSYIFWSFGIQ